MLVALLGTIILVALVRRRKKKNEREVENIPLEDTEKASQLSGTRRIDWSLPYSELEMGKQIGSGGT